MTVPKDPPPPLHEGYVKRVMGDLGPDPPHGRVEPIVRPASRAVLNAPPPSPGRRRTVPACGTLWTSAERRLTSACGRPSANRRRWGINCRQVKRQPPSVEGQPPTTNRIPPPIASGPPSCKKKKGRVDSRAKPPTSLMVLLARQAMAMAVNAGWACEEGHQSTPPLRHPMTRHPTESPEHPLTKEPL